MPDEQLIFFPKGSIVGLAGRMPYNFYTLPVDTRKYLYVTVGLSIEIPNWNSNADIRFTPQISNGGGTWADITPVVASPFSTPYYNVIKVETIGALMRFKISVMDPSTPLPPNGSLDTAICFSLIGSGHWEDGEEFFEYPIWQVDSILTYVGAGGTKYIYSDPFDTEGYKECVIALRADIPVIGGGALVPATGEIVAVPQRSNDQVEWKTDSTPFTALTPGGTYPYYEVRKYSELGRFCRLMFALNNTGGTPISVGGALYAQAVMR